MNTLINDIIINLKLITFASALLCCLWASNFLFSLYYNIGIIKQKFQKKVLIKGILKIIILSLGLVFVTIGVTTIPTYLVYTGIKIDENILTGINIVVILFMFTKSITYYAQQALETLAEIIKK